MNTKKEYWEYTILAAMPHILELHSLAVGDVMGDGRNVMVTGGKGGLFWFRPDTLEQGTIDTGFFHVGLAVEDLDGDGRLEVVAAEQDTATQEFHLVWYKAGQNIEDPWTKNVLDSSCAGNPHDILFVDIDGDGKREMLAVAAYSVTPGIYLYKHHGEIHGTWDKYQIMNGHLTEGLAVGDLNSDGRLEIVSGPDWYICPKAGPYSGLWERKVFAPNFRDMCRMALIDITGNGRQDIVIVESEYREGQFSWFENRTVEQPEAPWVEHRIGDGYVFAHSLQAWKDKDGVPHVFVAEMAKGGWNPPYNFDARLLEFTVLDKGNQWQCKTLYHGAGTHQAIRVDIDNDGEMEIMGKTWKMPVIQCWKERKEPSLFPCFTHQFIDRDKPETCTDILAVDIDGDGLEDVVCGRWWYKNPTWERYEIPGIYQALIAFDVDGDGPKELIGTKKASGATSGFTPTLTSEFYWYKPMDALQGEWQEYFIGKGIGSWPHGVTVAPVMEEGKNALIASYHSAKHEDHFPELFEIPEDPTQGPWEKRILAEIRHGEEMKAADFNRNGRLDIAAGNYWLENMSKGSFKENPLTEGFESARLDIADINGDGFPDIVIGEEVLDFVENVAPFSRLAWFENPGSEGEGVWKMHVIDILRCPHSISVFDLDGDGEAEIICGEHDPFKPYRSRSRLFVYKKADPLGKSWHRYLVDDRFEHHDGAKIIQLSPGKFGIISHGWKDNQFVHLWQLP